MSQSGMKLYISLTAPTLSLWKLRKVQLGFKEKTNDYFALYLLRITGTYTSNTNSVDAGSVSVKIEPSEALNIDIDLQENDSDDSTVQQDNSVNQHNVTLTEKSLLRDKHDEDLKTIGRETTNQNVQIKSELDNAVLDDAGPVLKKENLYLLLHNVTWETKDNLPIISSAIETYTNLQKDVVKVEQVEQEVTYDDRNLNNSHLERLIHNCPDLNKEDDSKPGGEGISGYAKDAFQSYFECLESVDNSASSGSGNTCPAEDPHEITYYPPGVIVSNTFSCHICLRIFPCEAYLHRHQHQYHNKTKSFGCDKCDLHFVTKHQLDSHKLSHSKPYACEICGKTFMKRGHLNYHKSIHNKNKHAEGAPPAHHCNVCGETFVLKGALNQHKLSHETTETTMLKCEICQEPFATKQALRAHKFTHGKPYGCDSCGKTFMAKGHLNYHKATQHKNEHTEGGLHSCNVCGKGFTLKGNLNQHKYVHDGEASYVPSVYQNSFANGASFSCDKLVTHNTAGKPFVCYVCGKTFTLRGNLNRHRQTCSRE